VTGRFTRYGGFTLIGSPGCPCHRDPRDGGATGHAQFRRRHRGLSAGQDARGMDRPQSGLQGATVDPGAEQGRLGGEIDYAGRKWKWTQNVDDGSIPGVLFIVVKVRPSDVTASGDNGLVRRRHGASLAMRSGVRPRGDLPSWEYGQPGLPHSTRARVARSPGARAWGGPRDSRTNPGAAHA